MSPQFKFRVKPEEPVSRFIEPVNNKVAYSKREMSFLAFKRFIWRYKLIFLGCMFVFLFLFRYLYLMTNNYQSEVTISFSGFEIPEYDVNENNFIPDFANMKEGMSRIYNIVYSKEMLDHLINKFNLYEHYHLGSANASSYVITRKILNYHIALFQGASRSITIQVTDKTSGIMPANIANEIALKANEMNRKYISEKIESRIQVYTRLHDEIKSRMDVDIQGIVPGVDKLNEVIAKNEAKSPEVEKVLNGLNEVSKKIQTDVEQLLQITKVNSWTLNSMKDDMVNNITVIQDALPGVIEENVPRWIMVILGIGASFLITLFLFNLVYTYRNYLHLLKV